jgi:hypothetical protein
MAKSKNDRNGLSDHTVVLLNESMATLNNAMSTFLGRASESDAQFAEMKRSNEERFARIEALLIEHSRILQALPDAVREKFGFRPPLQG